MVLLIIFFLLYLASIVAFFLKPAISQQYRRPLLHTHLVAAIVLAAIVVCMAQSGISFRPGVVQLPYFLFLSTAIGLFALYRSTLHFLLKLYFGFFFVYPTLALATFFIDRIMFVLATALVAGPLLSPTALYSDSRYEIRAPRAAFMGVPHIALVEKNWLTEKDRGYNSDIRARSFTDGTLRVVEHTPDSTVIVVTLDGVPTTIVFR